MKLNLRHEDSVAILEVSGAVDGHNLNVLKAGITKLLQDGKNRIVLYMLDATELQGDVIRDLAIIDVYARELAGKIILVSPSKELKESVKLFAKPPVVPILSSLEQALDFFKKAGPQEEDEEESGALKAQLEAKNKEIESLEARLKRLDPSEIQNLRALNAQLKTKVTFLEEQIEQVLKERRNPSDTEGFLEKISALEESVKRLSAAEKH